MGERPEKREKGKCEREEPLRRLNVWIIFMTNAARTTARVSCRIGVAKHSTFTPLLVNVEKYLYSMYTVKSTRSSCVLRVPIIRPRLLLPHHTTSIQFANTNPPLAPPSPPKLCPAALHETRTLARITLLHLHKLTASSHRHLRYTVGCIPGRQALTFLQ